MQTQAVSMRAPRTDVMFAGLGVLAASILFGLVPMFARGLGEAGLAPHAIAFQRYGLTALVLLPAVWAARRAWRALAWGAVAGMGMGLGWVGYVAALSEVSVATAGVIYMTYPAFTLIVAWALFGDWPHKLAVVAAAMILFAALLAAGPEALAAGTSRAILVAFAAPLGFAFGICVLVHRLGALGIAARVGCVTGGAALGLLPLVLATPVAAAFPSQIEDWLLVGGLAFATALLPQWLYTVCAPRVGTARAAILGAVELPTMFVVGYLAFAEAISPSQTAAGLLVLVAIWLGQRKG